MRQAGGHKNKLRLPLTSDVREEHADNLKRLGYEEDEHSEPEDGEPLVASTSVILRGGGMWLSMYHFGL